MSIRLMSAVWATSRSKGSARLVMLALADIANDAGECYPSVAHLAEKTRLSRRSVQTIYRSLVEMGELEIDEQGSRYRTNMFRLTIGEGAKSARGGCSGLHGEGAAGCTGGVQRAAPNPSIEPSDDPSDDPAPRKRAGAAPVLTDDDRRRLFERFGETDVVRETIELALSHKSARNYGDIYAFVAGWLRRDEARGMINGSRTSTPDAGPGTGGGLSRDRRRAAAGRLVV